MTLPLIIPTRTVTFPIAHIIVSLIAWHVFAIYQYEYRSVINILNFEFPEAEFSVPQEPLPGEYFSLCYTQERLSFSLFFVVTFPPAFPVNFRVFSLFPPFSGTRWKIALRKNLMLPTTSHTRNCCFFPRLISVRFPFPGCCFSTCFLYSLPPGRAERLPKDFPSLQDDVGVFSSSIFSLFSSFRVFYFFQAFFRYPQVSTTTDRQSLSQHSIISEYYSAQGFHTP